MSEYIVEGADLTAVANAIKSKGQTTAPLVFPQGMVNAINNIFSGGGCGNWSKVEVEQWTPAKNTQAYALPKEIAEKINFLIISRPHEGAIKDEVRLAIIENPVQTTYGAAIVDEYGDTVAIEYVSFMNGLSIPSYTKNTFVGGQTYTVTKCFKK